MWVCLSGQPYLPVQLPCISSTNESPRPRKLSPAAGYTNIRRLSYCIGAPLAPTPQRTCSGFGGGAWQLRAVFFCSIVQFNACVCGLLPLSYSTLSNYELVESTGYVFFRSNSTFLVVNPYQVAATKAGNGATYTLRSSGNFV